VKYFSKAKSIDEAKALYKKLALANHPDVNATPEATAIMQEINSEFDMVFKFLKMSTPVAAKETETSTHYREGFYTANGWKGDKYDSSLHGKDIAKLLREYVKFVYPLYKFSITSDYHSVDVYAVEGPVSLLVPVEEAIANILSSPDAMYYYNNSESYVRETLNRDYGKQHSINHFYIDKDDTLTDFAKLMFTDIKNFLVDYTRDDSDSQTDYFDCNLYQSLGIGKWDKAYKIVEKTARITPTQEVRGAKKLTA